MKAKNGKFQYKVLIFNGFFCFGRLLRNVLKFNGIWVLCLVQNPITQNEGHHHILLHGRSYVL